ncbi:hypothetical protein BDK51DRAFT_21615 [Blyttiomyces helicus]|uniref:SAM-dependent methyltransferase Erg6/SMT-type domain-containing protein n=1 Tax=Blyttiomyces helicus TaxID=388810 RepID=A0A4P9W1R2_9FUNG|nr:hypothetical protein BDK51DRAFT_21615 [Blyttiomyces helicus]|eukprot:RKO84688.1 hypothetical protein BDK51DRAFT_21615 [Blyttiomyces helicus]
MVSTDYPTPVQDPTLDPFIHRLRKKTTDALAHKSTVDSYASYWDKDHARGALADTSETVVERRKASGKITNHYYDLVTDFYEYGWGTSFHFARMFRESTFRQCISRHEDYLALKLGLTGGMKCLDVGCGVGE